MPGISAGSGISQLTWQFAATMAANFLKNGDAALLGGAPMAYAKLQQLF